MILPYSIDKAIEKATILANMADEVCYIVIDKKKYLPVFKEYFTNGKENRRVYHIERPDKVLNSNAFLYGSLQNSGKKQRGKNNKGCPISNEPESQIVGTADYSRWLSEVNRYCYGE
jgi:hypothetical protein